jgi:hypothetical protein
MPHPIACAVRYGPRLTVRKTIIGGHRLRARFFNEIKHNVGATVGTSSFYEQSRRELYVNSRKNEPASSRANH